MVKNKNIRDFALVIFMLIVVISFVVYQFVPSKNNNSKEKKNEKIIEKKSDNLKSTSAIENDTKKEEENNRDFEKKDFEDKSYIYVNKLEDLLIEYFNNLNKGELNFNEIDVKNIITNIQDLINNLNQEQSLYKEYLNKVNKYDLITLINNFNEFNNLGENNRERFVIFISVFLKSISNNDIVFKYSFDKKLLKKYMNFDIYKLINFEIEKGYQLIPVFFYLKLLINNSSLFEKNPLLDDFIVKLENLKDMTNKGFIQNILLKIYYVTKRIKINIYWIEEDNLDPDDIGEYLGVNVKLYKNFGLEFLIFPDDLGNNKWINDLINSDSNAIEVKYLWIEKASLEKNSDRITLFYSKKLSEFFILFGDINSYLRQLGNDFLDRLIYKNIQKFRNTMNEIVIVKNYKSVKVFEEFSLFLKKRILKIIN